MKRLSAVTIILALISLGFLPLASAEVITLKSGLKFEAKVLEKKDDCVIIDWQGQTVRYLLSEIERIEEAAPAVKEQKEDSGFAAKPEIARTSESGPVNPQQVAQYLNQVSSIINAVNEKTAEKQGLLAEASMAANTEKMLTIATEIRNALAKHKQKFLALTVPKGCETLYSATRQLFELQAGIYDEIIKGNIEQVNLLSQELQGTSNMLNEEASRLIQSYGLKQQ